MACIVMKFGGTSVGNCELIKNVARHVKTEIDQGNKVVVVVSAMSGITDSLIDYCKQISPMPDICEYDAVIATGEQVTAGLLAIALQELNIPTRSWAGWQIPIKTDGIHGKARVESIITTELEQLMAIGYVSVVAGFQGISSDNRVTTLGRGGSDTSALAIAVAIKADRCDIYTDVDGIYTADPRIVFRARKLNKITYEEMLELASLGAKVLQTRSIEIAMKYLVRVQVLSSFVDSVGTLICNEDEIVEKELVSGVTYNRDEAKITLIGVADCPGVAASIFGPLNDANINVDMIVQNVSDDNIHADVTFTVSKSDLDFAIKVLNKKQKDLNYERLLSDSNVSKISIIGSGMRSHSGVALKMFKTLAEKSINIQVISTSEIKVSVLISEEYTELAIRALHSAYGLDI
ncbi:MAG: aspartate kinase [Rhodospirillaceae bacterium]|nr:aspartate kinase [Rhodospirillaceae bacterium]